MSIEFCPRCSARVRVPIAAEPESWVRCPRCRVESQLSEILSAEPPLLELIDGPSGKVPSYEPVLAGVGAEGEGFDDFNVTASDTLVVDEDSPTLPLGGLAMGDSFYDEDAGAGGASIGRATAIRKEDDELFGFDDNPDVASLRTTTDDGKYMEVPADGDEEFNLSPDASADFGEPSAKVPSMGAGFGAIPTTPPRRKKKSNPIVTMLGVAGGGLIGITIAYYGILMWAMGQDPFQVAKHFPEGMQMLLPPSLQKKPIASNDTIPSPADPGSSLTGPMLPSDGTPSPEGTNPLENNPGLPGTPTDNTPTDPLDPAAMPEKSKTPADPLDPLDPLAGGNLPPPKTALDPLDPLAGNLPPPKPSNDPNDPFNNPGANPAMPKPEVTTPVPADPLDPLATPLTPPKPEVTTPPLAVDPLDPLATPLKPEMPAKPEVATITPDPLDPLAPKPADPLLPKPADPLDPLAPKPADPLTPKPIDPLDPLAVKPIDPLTPPQPADPLAAPAKPKEPLMLASASYAPEELLKSIMQVETAAGTLTQAPADRSKQAQAYRAFGHVGEVAGQLKSLGETDETAQVNLDSIQALAKKLADDPNVSVLNNLTFFWLTIPPEKRNQGIILQGIPGPSEPLGKLFKSSLDVANPDPTMPGLKLSVISEFPLLPNKEGKITALGVIVEKPTEQIPGYTGPTERVIWVSVGQMEKPATPAVEAKSPAAPPPAKAPGDDPFGDIK
jgi:hypothetical protein